MKEFKLCAWPELPRPYHRTAYRRMLCDMSARYVTFAHLVASSGIGRMEVRRFLEMLADRGLLLERESAAGPDSILDSLRPLGGWIVRTLTNDAGRR